MINPIENRKGNNRECRIGGTSKKNQGTMVDLNPNKSVIRINSNELNTPIKRQRLSFKKKKSNYTLPVLSQSVESKRLKNRTGLFPAHEITLGGLGAFRGVAQPCPSSAPARLTQAIQRPLQDVAGITPLTFLTEHVTGSRPPQGGGRSSNHTLRRK